jgi:phage FluMu protein Com
VIWTVLGTLGIVFATMVAGLWADRRWTLLPRREDLQLGSGMPHLLPGHVDGEAPATAVAASVGEIERIRRKQRCPRCKVALDSAADDTVIYEGTELRVLQFTCPRCHGLRSVYIHPVSS